LNYPGLFGHGFISETGIDSQGLVPTNKPVKPRMVIVSKSAPITAPVPCFRCAQCGVAFLKANGLALHQKTHNRELVHDRSREHWLSPPSSNPSAEEQVSSPAASAASAGARRAAAEGAAPRAAAAAPEDSEPEHESDASSVVSAFSDDRQISDNDDNDDGSDALISGAAYNFFRDIVWRQGWQPSRGLPEWHVSPRGRGLVAQRIALLEPYCGWFTSIVRRKAHGSGTEEYYVSFEAGEEQIRELSADNYFRSTEAGEEWSLPADEAGSWCLLEPRAAGWTVTPPLSPQLSEAGDELSENGNGELDMDADDEAALAF
jgi:hypothetical protein